MPGDRSPQGLSDGCLWAQEYAALAKTLHAKIQKKRESGVEQTTGVRSHKTQNRVVLLPPRLGLIRVILLLLTSRVPRRFKYGKFSSLTISLSDKSIVSNWSCRENKKKILLRKSYRRNKYNYIKWVQKIIVPIPINTDNQLSNDC